MKGRDWKVAGMQADDQINPIAAMVAGRGGMSFRDYMDLALYHPEYGYYGAGRATLGRQGDYFTSVSTGAIFGEMLAQQFAEMWEILGQPDGFAVVEQGANDGAFAVDVLGWCRAARPDFFEAMRYVIVEPLAVAEGRQRERLGEFGGRVEWCGSMEALRRFTGVHFSNELVDAFPVHVARYREDGWKELWVGPEMEWVEKPASAEVLARLEDAPKLDGLDGYTTEVNLAALEWAAAVSAKLERGWVLAIDYGFPRDQYLIPERTGGTLECYASHRRGLNPLEEAGFRDITAHVDFTSLAEAFLGAGMTMAGYTDQHHFFTGLAAAAFAATVPSEKQARGLKMLLHPELLGRAFKVLGVSRGVPDGGIAGFRYARDWRRGLGI